MKEYSKKEWEEICTHCGKCCLHKLEDEDTGDVYYTNVVCQYFDEKNMCCSVYDKRTELVPTCLQLNPQNVSKLSWMPKSCAYRQLFEKNPCKISTSIKGRVINAKEINEDDIEDYIVDWEDL